MARVDRSAIRVPVEAVDRSPRAARVDGPRRGRALGFGALPLLLASLASAQTGAPPQESKSDAQLMFEDVARQIASPDPAVQQKGVDRIKTQLAGPELDEQGQPRRYKFKFSYLWAQALIKVKRYADFEAFYLPAMRLSVGDSRQVAMLQKTHMQALLATKQYDTAIRAGKIYYDTCLLVDSEQAINYLSTALLNGRPEDKALVRRFKTQQLAAATQPTTQPAATTGLGENVLRSIPVDAGLFEDLLKTLDFADYPTLIARGNVLLLCDHGREARECFEAAQDIAPDQRFLSQAIEGVARAIRAETGAIGPANAYVVARQQALQGK